jgi:aminoglycoside phosphotransferase (APT) family kinase protein
MEINKTEQNSKEIPLAGGRLTPGVVRIGKTVRRPVLPSSPFVSQLLIHLETVGFTGSPRYLGQDEGGREILTFIEGSVPEKFQHFEDNQICEAARLLRQFHDATQGCELTGKNSVICHHDPGPNNTVFQNGQPVAFIDFDLAAPGEPMEDLAYMAWTWCISSKPERGPTSQQAEQVRLLLNSYGMKPSEWINIIDAISERQLRNIQFWQHYKETAVTKEKIEKYVIWTEKEKSYTEANRSVFEEMLR